MSGVVGKGTKSLKKLKDQNSLIPNIGFKSLQFMHEATAGDTVIDLQNLNAPASAVSNGFVQPTSSDLGSVNLKQFESNLVLRSDQRESLIPYVDYVISGTQNIKLLSAALANEIFVGTLLSAPKNGISLADARPLVSTNTLAAGDTDVNVGTPFKVGEYQTEQIGSLMVFADGQLQFRNINNQSNTEGDYYEVNAGGGMGIIIRFNDPDLINDREIVVVSVGSLVERPQESISAVLENVQGQLDSIIPVLAQVAGLPESDFYTAPNNIDLKAFGDLVNSNEDRITALEDINETEIVVNTGLGYGSTNTNIFRFSNVEKNVGDITRTSNATDGDSFEILSDGVYSCFLSLNFSAGNRDMGISLNSNQLTTSITGINQADRLAITRTSDQPNSTGSVSVTRRFSTGDIIRAHTDSGSIGSSAVQCIFSITKVGK